MFIALNALIAARSSGALCFHSAPTERRQSGYQAYKHVAPPEQEPLYYKLKCTEKINASELPQGVPHCEQLLDLGNSKGLACVTIRRNRAVEIVNGLFLLVSSVHHIRSENRLLRSF
jgi:hypothetical protein